MSELFIPKKIKVGFQKRDGTYTGKLAYVIYIDNKGILRKEKSWQSWRDHGIAIEEFNNDPQDGFCLNKDVKRFNWSHFGSNRSYIRMYDPRGIEFEVTPENLIGILTETDCLKRGLQGKCVYAWKGTELVLLPCVSEEYNKAKENTERQDQDISAKDLKPGHSYTTKKGEEVIYIGRFPWFEWNKYNDKPRKSTKQHIFAYPEVQPYQGRFFKKSDVKFLAVINSDSPVINYAELIDEWNSDARSSEIKGWEFLPEDVSSIETFMAEVGRKQNGIYQFAEKFGDTIIFWYFQEYFSHISKEHEFYIHENGRLDTLTMTMKYDNTHRGYNDSTGKEKVIERIKKSFKVNALLSNGKKILVRSAYDIP